MSLRASLLAPERFNTVKLLKAVNTLGRVLPQNGHSLLSLEEGALTSKAREQTSSGCSFGDDALFSALESSSSL